tara:strand:- start:358 stop:849 length:492 start_codon:yes stop_codon:yes gene_type:complete
MTDLAPMNTTHGFKKWILYRYAEDEWRRSAPRPTVLATHKLKMKKVNAEFLKKFKQYEKDMINEVAREFVYKRYYTNISRHQVTTDNIHQCCSIGIRGIQFYGIPLFTYAAYDRRRSRTYGYSGPQSYITTFRSCVQFYTAENYTAHNQVLHPEPTVVRDYFC